jgi:hypothetical protein
MLCTLTHLSRFQMAATAQSEETTFGLVNDYLAEMTLVTTLGYGEDVLPSSPLQAIMGQAKTVLANRIDFEPASLAGIRQGRPIELEPVLGELLRKAKKANTSMPVRSSFPQIKRYSN